MKKVIGFLIVAGLVACDCLSQIPTQIIPAGDSCRAILPDYRDQVTVRDNCEVDRIIQTPPPGTVLDANNLLTNVIIAATDKSGNTSAINFDVLIYDDEPPVIIPDSSLLTYTWEERFGLLDSFQSSLNPYINDSIQDTHNLVMISSPDMKHAGGWYPADMYVVPLTDADIDSLGWQMISLHFDPSLAVSLPFTIDAGSPTDDWFIMQEGGRVAHPELDLPEMYESERFGNFSYRIPVGTGTFNVELHFAEIYWDEPGERIFSVAMEGAPIPDLQEFDIVAMVGAMNPVVFDFDVTVYDGWLDLGFTTTVDFAKISGIVIKERPLLSIIN